MVLVNIIKSYHDNMQAKISISDSVAHATVSDKDVFLPLHLPSCFFNIVIWCWCGHCQHLGIELLYKCRGDVLVRELEYPCRLG